MEAIPTPGLITVIAAGTSFLSLVVYFCGIIYQLFKDWKKSTNQCMVICVWIWTLSWWVIWFTPDQPFAWSYLALTFLFTGYAFMEALSLRGIHKYHHLPEHVKPNYTRGEYLMGYAVVLFGVMACVCFILTGADWLYNQI